MKKIIINKEQLFSTEQSFEDFVVRFCIVEDESIDQTIEQVEVLVEITDLFGSDHILQLSTGHIVVTIRNCGQHLISSSSVDQMDFLSYINSLMN